MRVALVCPYAWDDPGGVQVHVRELAPRLADRGHHVVVLAPVRGRADEPWVAPVGRPVDIPYNASNAPIDPRPWSRHRVRAVLERFAPDVVHVHEPLTPSTSMWATLASRGAGGRDLPLGSDAVAAVRPGGAGAPPRRSADRGADRGLGSRRRVRP